MSAHTTCCLFCGMSMMLVSTRVGPADEAQGIPVDPAYCGQSHTRFLPGPTKPIPGDVLYYATPLGKLPGCPEWGQSGGAAINECGQVTGVGNVEDYRIEAFLWDQVDGMTGLGDLPGGLFCSVGQAINNLGHVAGYSQAELGSEAFLCTPERAMIGLGDLPGGSYCSEAYGVNDFDQVVGVSRSGSGEGNSEEAFLWDRAFGMIALGDFPGGQYLSLAFDINNATQVTGVSGSARHYFGEAFIWDPANGMRPLGNIPGGGYAVYGSCINELGQIAGDGSRAEAFLWDPEAGFVTLGFTYPDDLVSHAWDLNDVGQVVGNVGCEDDSVHHGFVWDAEHGMRRVGELLAAGTDPDFLWLELVTGINNAGQIIANPHDFPEALLLDPFVLGDLNCDALVEEADIEALLLLLVDPDEYQQTYPDCPGRWAGDIDQDAAVDMADWCALLRFLGHPVTAPPTGGVAPDGSKPLP